MAIKLLHDDAGEKDRVALLSEAVVTAQFKHSHVISLVGVVTAGYPLMVVLEYCEHGALESYLRLVQSFF